MDMELYEDIYDPDYIDIEALIVDAMDYEICEHSSIGQSAVLITLRLGVRFSLLALKDTIQQKFYGSQTGKAIV